MRFLLSTLAGLAVLVTLAAMAVSQDPPKPVVPEVPQAGPLLLLGGLEAFEHGVLEALGELGADAPNVLIIPHASDDPKRGELEKKAFEELGVGQVNILQHLEGEDTIALLNQANVIWFSDGSPGHLMRQLAASGLISNFYRWHKAGALIGANGLTAGVLGAIYIEGLITEPYMTHLSVRPRRGLGLWHGLVVTDMMNDNRLAHGISAVLDQPRLNGLCQDDRSAVRIQGDDMYFTGHGASIYVNASKAKKTFVDEESVHSVRNAQLHSFAFGEKFTWFQ